MKQNSKPKHALLQLEMLLEKGENQRVLKVQRDAALLFVVECKNAEQKKAQNLPTDAVRQTSREWKKTERQIQQKEPHLKNADRYSYPKYQKVPFRHAVLAFACTIGHRSFT